MRAERRGGGCGLERWSRTCAGSCVRGGDGAGRDPGADGCFVCRARRVARRAGHMRGHLRSDVSELFVLQAMVQWLAHLGTGLVRVCHRVAIQAMLAGRRPRRFGYRGWGDGILYRTSDINSAPPRDETAKVDSVRANPSGSALQILLWSLEKIGTVDYNPPADFCPSRDLRLPSVDISHSNYSLKWIL